ncbi:MAG TPA: hypothetical protein VI775_00085 [Candidatus Paceibacterota bacterium]
MSITKEIGKNPRIDWILILTISFIIAVVVVLGSVYLYKIVTIDKIVNTDASKVEFSKFFDQKALSELMNNYSEREKVQEKARVMYTGFGDPSL